MAIGTPFPTRDFKISVASSISTPVWKDVGGMESWDGDVTEAAGETEVFHQEDPLETQGKPKGSFSLNGKLLTAADDGQAIINAAIAAKAFFIMQVLWDGTNGFSAVVRVNTRRRATRAGNNLTDTSWNFTVKPSTITIVGTGPAF